MTKTDKEESFLFVSKFHLKRARKANADGDFNKARHEYKRSVKALEHNNIMNTSLFSEYKEFVKRDPHFTEIAKAVCQIIKEKPSVTLGDFFVLKIAPDIEPVDLHYFFDFAEELGYVKENDKGQLVLTNET